MRTDKAGCHTEVGQGWDRKRDCVWEGWSVRPAGHLLACRNFVWQWTKFCVKYSMRFCFGQTKFALFFKLLFYFRNFQRSRQILPAKTLPSIYDSSCFSFCCAQPPQGAWHLYTYSRNHEQAPQAYPKTQNLKQFFMPTTWFVWQRYCNFRHWPDYFVLCL